MIRRGLGILAAITLVAVAVTPATSPAAAPVPGDGPYRVQMVYRTGPSLAPFDLSIVASSDNDYGMWFAVELIRHHGRWTENADSGFGGYHEIIGPPYPTVYGRPETSALPSCPGMPGCAYPVPFDGSQNFHVTPTATSRYYIISTNASVRIDLDTKGWRVKDVPNPGFRRVFTSHTQATGLRTASVAVEHFTSASAPGGRYGSSAFAYVPCDRGGTGTARITARGATTGNGIPPETLRCGPFGAYDYEYAYTPYQTTWRVDGDVVGSGDGLARLAVFDFPKP
jgi:hypothetical protein